MLRKKTIKMKFKRRSRFKMVENELKIKGKNIEESSINEMDEIWNEIKTNSN